VSEQPPAELLRRLRPIPTYRDHPATEPCDIAGTAPDGRPVSVAIVGAAEPVLLLFLTAACDGCQDLWHGGDELRAALPPGMRVVVLTPGPDREDPAAVAALAAPGTEVVMSSQAWADYRVAGPPFLVVVDGAAVRTEGVAWGVGETARTARTALARG